MNNTILERVVEYYDAGNYKAAAEILLPLAQAGDVEAQSMLGSYYISDFIGFNSTKEWEVWMESLLESEEGSEIRASYVKEQSDNLQQAHHWLTLASDQGSVPATVNLTTVYFEILQNPTPQNPISREEAEVKLRELAHKLNVESL